MIAIIDYGAGNLFSVKNALEYIGEPYLITSSLKDIKRADSYILPGVGAFPYAMGMLTKTNLVGELKRQVTEYKKPLLGICLGMQMLFEKGCEFEEVDGLGLIPGYVDHIPKTSLKIPHMGWNHLNIKDDSNALLQGVRSGDCAYFVHSFMAYPHAENLAASCDYGTEVPALVASGTIYGAQFHPEKSGAVGLQILRNFGGLTK